MYLPSSFTKSENCGLPDVFTDYQIRHISNPSGLPEILLPDVAITHEDYSLIFSGKFSTTIYSQVLIYTAE